MKSKQNLVQYVKADRALKNKAHAFAEKIELQRNKLATKYIDQNSPVKVGKIYEIVSGGVRRKGYSRFAIYGQRVQFMNNDPIIVVGGWWINKQTNKADKWDGGVVVLGVGNPTVFKLSEDQTHIKPELNLL